MNEHNSLLSTREAAEIVGYSVRHIQTMIKKGKLSAIRDEAGNYIIDKSEFYRVFPDANAKRTETKKEALEVEITYLKEMVAEKSRQNEFLVQQLQESATEKTALIETLNSNQRLLEHKSKPRKKFLGLF